MEVPFRLHRAIVGKRGKRVLYVCNKYRVKRIVFMCGGQQRIAKELRRLSSSTSSIYNIKQAQTSPEEAEPDWEINDPEVHEDSSKLDDYPPNPEIDWEINDPEVHLNGRSMIRRSMRMLLS